MDQCISQLFVSIAGSLERENKRGVRYFEVENGEEGGEQRDDAKVVHQSNHPGHRVS